MVQPGLQPTEFHERFLTTGRWCETVSKPLARLDLPEMLTLPTNRPVLLAGNHRSLFDFMVTMIIFTRFGLSSRIMIRADLVESGVSGWLLQGIGAIATSRHTRQDAEDAAVEALRRGEVVSMMPEGRLIPSSELGPDGVGPARPGLSRIARRSGAAVVPVAFGGTNQVWPRGGSPRLKLKRPNVALRLGDAFELTGDDDQANTDAFMRHLGALVRSLG